MSGHVSEWDTEYTFLTHYGMTPDQLYALDPDFVEDVMARMKVEAELSKPRNKRGGK